MFQNVAQFHEQQKYSSYGDDYNRYSDQIRWQKTKLKGLASEVTLWLTW